MSTPSGDQPHDRDQPPSWDPNQGYGQQSGQGYGQGYGQQSGQEGGYGYPAAPPPQGSWGQPRQDHPRAILSLILGIVGLVLCGVAAPFAWVIGKRAVDEIDASGGRLGGRGVAQAGKILGIIGTVLVILGLLVFVLVLTIGGFAAFESSA